MAIIVTNFHQGHFPICLAQVVLFESSGSIV